MREMQNGNAFDESVPTSPQWDSAPKMQVHKTIMEQYVMMNKHLDKVRYCSLYPENARRLWRCPTGLRQYNVRLASRVMKATLGRHGGTTTIPTIIIALIGLTPLTVIISLIG